MSRVAAISIRVRPSAASAIPCGAFAGNPFALALEHDLAFELRQGRHDGEDHAAHRAGHAAVGRGRWFDRHRRVEDLERYAARAELRGDRQRIACRPRQAIEPGYDQFIARPQDAPAQQVEFGPPAGPLLTFRPSGGSAGIAATPCWPERQDSTLTTKCAFRKEWPAVIRDSHFAQPRGHWAS